VLRVTDSGTVALPIEVVMISQDKKTRLLCDLVVIRSKVWSAWKRESKPVFSSELHDLLSKVNDVLNQIEAIPTTEEAHAGVQEEGKHWCQGLGEEGSTLASE
jgi:hypothetical protein